MTRLMDAIQIRFLLVIFDKRKLLNIQGKSLCNLYVYTHPQILDNGCDDHPSPTTAASTVNQAVATLEIEDVGDVKI